MPRNSSGSIAQSRASDVDDIERQIDMQAAAEYGAEEAKSDNFFSRQIKGMGGIPAQAVLGAADFVSGADGGSASDQFAAYNAGYGQQSSEQIKQNSPMPDVQMAVEGAMQQVPGVIAAGAVGGPAGPIGMFAANEYGAAKGQALLEGMGQEEAEEYAKRRAVTEGGVTAAFSAVGAGGLESMKPAAGNLLKSPIKTVTEFGLKQLTPELAEELTIEMAHLVTDQQAGMGEITGETVGETIKQTTLQTVATMGLMEAYQRSLNIANPEVRKETQGVLEQVAEQNGQQLPEPVEDVDEIDIPDDQGSDKMSEPPVLQEPPQETPAETTPPQGNDQGSDKMSEQQPEPEDGGLGLSGMGEGVADNYYDGLRKSIEETGDVPSAESNSNVGVAWKQFAKPHGVSADDFVTSLRDAAPDTPQEWQDFANSFQPPQEPAPENESSDILSEDDQAPPAPTESLSQEGGDLPTVEPEGSVSPETEQEAAQEPAPVEAAAEEQQEEAPDYGTAEKLNRVEVGKWYEGKIGEHKNINQARKAVGELVGGKIEPGTTAAKDVDEAVEQGVVRRARKIVRDRGRQGGSQLGEDLRPTGGFVRQAAQPRNSHRHQHDRAGLQHASPAVVRRWNDGGREARGNRVRQQRGQRDAVD